MKKLILFSVMALFIVSCDGSVHRVTSSVAIDDTHQNEYLQKEIYDKLSIDFFKHEVLSS